MMMMIIIIIHVRCSHHDDDHHHLLQSLWRPSSSSAYEKIVLILNVFVFKVALFARLSLMSRHLCPFMQQLQGFHKMQKSKTHFHSAKLQYCSKFLTRKRIITLKSPFKTLRPSERNRSRTFLVREEENLRNCFKFVEKKVVSLGNWQPFAASSPVHIRPE